MFWKISWNKFHVIFWRINKQLIIIIITGQHRSHRIVNRECIEDNEEETPSDGESTEETESRDGDRDAFSQRKEDRTIDYFKVPKGMKIM